MPDALTKRLLIALSVLALFGIITFALTAATLGTLNKQYNELKNIVNVATTTQPSLNSILAQSIRIEDLMGHLNELQRIGDNSGNTRAIGTSGFDGTLNYIYNYLLNNTSVLNVFRETFPVQNFTIKGTPILSLFVDGNTTEFTYSATDLPKAEFTHVNYSTAVNLTQLNVTVVPNYGCSDSDWQNVTGRAALVMAGGTCTSGEKGVFANNRNAAALLFYNNGLTVSNLAPSIVRLRQANKLPALYLSYATGQKIADENNKTNVFISISIDREAYPPFNVDNICADTRDGYSNETIVVGSHSDSVPAGPGINDNGSGTIATLVLATNLARLYQSGNYNKYRYRVRFCWWGAEEIGLAGSIYHVQKARNESTIPGNRLSDYLINLNYDMLGSPNYIFGIYNGSSAKADTPVQALPGSIRISETFRNWFSAQNLPWDYTDFSGRSDYGPFLAEGIVAGGLFSGADGVKTQEERNRYDKILGQGMGGIPGIIHDPCYHQACDSIQNINVFVYERMVQAAAYILEYLGRTENLSTWLYPTGRR